MERVAGLSKIWAEARFGFANFDLVPDLDWDARYLEFIPRVQAASSTYDYYRVLMAFVAALRDGHTGVAPPRQLVNRFWAAPGFRTALVDDKVIVRRITHSSATVAGVRVGQEIVAVNGEPVKAYAEREVTPYQVASTPQDLDARVYDYSLLAGNSADTLQLRIRDLDGSVRDLRVARRAPEDLRETDPPALELEWLSGDIVHVRLNNFDDRSITSRFEKDLPEIAARAKGLILDVREGLVCNPISLRLGAWRQYGKGATRHWHARWSG